MAQSLHVYPAAPRLNTALVAGLNQPHSPAAFPMLAFGGKEDVDLYLTDGAGGYQARSGASGYSPRITVTRVDPAPVAGTFTLSDGTDTTAPLDYDARASEVQAALNALNGSTGPHADTVTVTRHGPGAYSIQFDTTASVAPLTADVTRIQPESTASIYEIVAGTASIREEQMLRITAAPLVYAATSTQITNGWRLTLNANNSHFYRALIEAQGDLSADYAIEIIDPLGRKDPVARGPVTLQSATTDPASLDAMNYPDILTTASVVNDRADITTLTGGAATALDSIDTTALSTGYTALLAVTISATVPGKIWRLVAGTDAEDPAAGTIRPDDYDATTNAKVWKVQL